MDAMLCSEHLDRLLTREASALATLQTLLDKEYETISNNDIESLDSTGAQRQECVGGLLRIEDERRALCRAMDYPMDAAGIDRLLTWCDPSHRLRRRWKETLKLATACRGLNERNGTLVAAKLRRVDGLLSVLTGHRKDGAVYGRNGVQHLNAGRSLGQA